MLVAGLLFCMSLQRNKNKRGYGVPDDPTSLMCKLYRAQVLTVEYAPMQAVLMLVIHLRTGGDLSVVHQFFMLFTIAARTAFVLALLRLKSLSHDSPLRTISALSSYFSFFGLGVIVMFGL